MKLKKLILGTLLVSLGLILNIMTPGLLGMMKPDFLLVFYLIALSEQESMKNSYVIILVAALMSSLTTAMPGGEFANFVDKVITGLIMIGIATLTKQFKGIPKSIIHGGLGTIISGTIFLLTLQTIGILDNNLMTMLVVIVLPTACVNVFVYQIFSYRFQ